MTGWMVIRTLGALLLVLGLLGGALWAVRRFDVRVPGGLRLGQQGAKRRIETVERIALDARRSLTLVRVDGQEHLILLAPDTNVLIASRDVGPADAPGAGEAAPAQSWQEALAEAVGRLAANDAVPAAASLSPPPSPPPPSPPPAAERTADQVDAHAVRRALPAAYNALIETELDFAPVQPIRYAVPARPKPRKASKPKAAATPPRRAAPTKAAAKPAANTRPVASASKAAAATKPPAKSVAKPAAKPKANAPARPAAKPKARGKAAAAPRRTVRA